MGLVIKFFGQQFWGSLVEDISVLRDAMFLAMLMVGVLVTPGLIVGLLVAVFQAATQINEMSLSFIPRLFITFMTFILAGPWLLKLFVSFTQRLYGSLPDVIF